MSGAYTCKYDKDPRVIYGVSTRRRRNMASDRRICDIDRSFHQRDVYPFFRRPDLSIEFDENDPNSFTPKLQLIGESGEPSGITRQYVKVRVKNSGGIIARNCRAKLKVVRNITSSLCPSDYKLLAWDTTETRYLDIARNDDEFLHVVFADSSFESIRQIQKTELHAMASTLSSFYDGKFIRAQDAFGSGEFEIEIHVLSEEGCWARAVYQLKVGDVYTSLKLDLVSHKQSRTVKRFVSRLVSPISNQLKRLRERKHRTTS